MDNWALGERVAERYPEFDDIGTSFGQRLDDVGGTIAPREPDCDKRYDRGPTFIGSAVKCFLDWV